MCSFVCLFVCLFGPLYLRQFRMYSVDMPGAHGAGGPVNGAMGMVRTLKLIKNFPPGVGCYVKETNVDVLT